MSPSIPLHHPAIPVAEPILGGSISFLFGGMRELACLGSSHADGTPRGAD